MIRLAGNLCLNVCAVLLTLLLNGAGQRQWVNMDVLRNESMQFTFNKCGANVDEIGEHVFVLASLFHDGHLANR